MTDWMALWDKIEVTVQMVSTYGFIGLIVLAIISFILRNRRVAIDCVIIALVLYIVSRVLANYGFEMIDFTAIIRFFQEIFQFFE